MLASNKTGVGHGIQAQHYTVLGGGGDTGALLNSGETFFIFFFVFFRFDLLLSYDEFRVFT